MTDETNNKPDYLGQGLRGPVWTAASVGIGGLALYALNTLARGGFGFGGGMPPAGDPPWARDMTYERELTKANAETAALQAKLDCQNAIIASERRYEDKFDAIEREICAQKVHNAVNDGAVAGIAAQTAQLQKLTAPYIVQPVMAASEGALNYVPPAFAAAKATGASTTTAAAA